MEEKNLKEKRETIITIVFSAIMVLAIVAMVIIFAIRKASAEEAIAEVEPDRVTTQKVFVEKDKIVEVEVEKEITQEVIQDGLRDMGVLITEEYYFTMVENYVKSKTFMKFITSESAFIYSYDGVVTAGVDFNEIKVVRDKANKKILIKVPASEIQNVDIDFDSFKIYSEKEGLWNPIKMSDYNESMVELKKAAINKAEEKDILKRADEEASEIIENFVKSFFDKNEYQIVVEQM
ncbi:MAG: DUF4230 domain-containing protein [Lachnospiraceae bacterium]|nr:DUF4230 domain-containing protein [Candidatus Colinaster scatohippi]